MIRSSSHLLLLLSGLVLAAACDHEAVLRLRLDVRAPPGPDPYAGAVTARIAVDGVVIASGPYSGSGSLAGLELSAPSIEGGARVALELLDATGAVVSRGSARMRDDEEPTRLMLRRAGAFSATLGPLGSTRVAARTALASDAVWLVGGDAHAFSTAVDRIDGDTTLIERKPALVTPRVAPVAVFAPEGSLVVLGGGAAGAEVLAPEAEAFTTHAGVPHLGSWAGVVASGAGTWTVAGGGTADVFALRWAEGAPNVTAMPPLRTSRGRVTLLRLGERTLAVGGSPTSLAEWVDNSSPPLTEPVVIPAAVSADRLDTTHAVVVALAERTVMVLDAKGGLTVAGALARGRASGAALTLESGLLLVIGGEGDAAGSAERWRWADGQLTFEDEIALFGKHKSAVVARLPSGGALVAGGTDALGVYAPIGAVYEP